MGGKATGENHKQKQAQRTEFPCLIFPLAFHVPLKVCMCWGTHVGYGRNWLRLGRGLLAPFPKVLANQLEVEVGRRGRENSFMSFPLLFFKI